MTDIGNRAIQILAISGLLAGGFLAQSALATDPPAKAADKGDSFTITCDEIGNDPETSPTYTCYIASGTGPKHKQLKDKDPPGTTQWSIDTNRMVVLSSSFGAALSKPHTLACPGWFFIGGKWVYVKC